MSDTARLNDLDGLSPEQRALFEQMLADDGVETKADEGIPRRADEGPAPLSFAQERLWFLEQLEPDRAAYVIPAAFRLLGPFDPAAFEAAWLGIAERHEVLRTAFPELAGAPVQRASERAFPHLPRVELSRLDPDARRRELRHLGRELSGRPFDLARGPLLRLAVARLGPEEHAAWVALHHTVADGWSLGVLVRELGAFYRARIEGRPPELEPLPIQYADYAAWQRRRLQGERLETLLEYWRGALASAPEVVELPVDRPRSRVSSRAAGTWRTELDGETWEALAELGRELRASSFMVLMAAFQSLLLRSGAGRDLMVGTPIAGREQVETEPLVGLFVNTLAIRTRLSGEDSFRDAVAAVKRATLGAYAHQELPFERLVEELRPERDPDHAPLVQVLFTFQNAPLGRLDLADLRLEPMPLEGGSGRFDLGLTAAEAGRGVVLEFDYRRGLFDPSTVRRLAGRLRRLIEAAVARPGDPLASLPLLTGAERAQVFVEWNDTYRPGTSGRVDELFAQRSRARPGAVAVTWPGGELSYGELDARANGLARRLRDLGVGPEVAVASCAGHGPWRVVAWVAILRAGGFCVSLDPTQPPERLAFLLGDCRPSVVLVEERHRAAVTAPGAEVVVLDGAEEAAAPSAEPPPPPALDGENLAYAVYTSGSTGVPKGVAISHAGLSNLVRWYLGFYGVGPEDRGSQNASPAFDASVRELWPYLVAGASVHVADEEVRSSPSATWRWWASAGLTLPYLVAPLAEAVLAEGIPADLDLRVRAFIVGGDRLHRGADPAAGFRLVNHYGPSECSVTCTVAVVPPEGSGRGLPAIGRPIENTRVVLRDRGSAPVPIGVPGELWVGGRGLARGYLGRPALTAERFVPDPEAGRSGGGRAGARIYRTGDLARWRADGQLDFLGRIDHQVQVLGMRVELAEVEAELVRHPAVREAAAAVRPSASGHDQLVAYTVCAEPAPDAGELRRFLSHRLPLQMIPTFYVALEALPLTANGKLDRSALPTPGGGAVDAGRAPRDLTEELLLGLFRQSLGVEGLGIDAGFFEHGGHSLLATRLIGRVREVFGVELPLRSIFERQSVAELAPLLDELRIAGTGGAIPPLEKVPHGDAVPLAFAQERLWFLHQMAPRSAVYNMPFGLELEGGLDRAALAASLRRVVERHEVLRTRFDLRRGEVVQVIEPEARIELPLIDLERLDDPRRGAEARRLQILDSRWPFDLSRGPSLRAALVRTGPERHLLIANLHHSIADGWAVGLLVDELGELYRGALAGGSRPLPPPPLQYADFALWQRGWLTGEVLEAEIDHWRRTLGESPRALELATDHKRPAIQTFRGGPAQEFSFPAALTHGLAELSHRAGTTLFMTLVAAYQALLSRHSGQKEFAVGTPIAGRHRPGTESVVGLFVNTLPIAADVSGAPDFIEVLARVRERMLEAHAHQDMPFEKLVSSLQLDRDLSRPPIVQAVISQNVPIAPVELPGLGLRRLPVDNQTAKNEVVLSIGQSGDRLVGAFEYNRDLFDPTTLRRLASHLRCLLEAVAEDPERPISALPLLTRAERFQSIFGWNDTAKPCPQEPFVHELFAEHARKRPDAEAITTPVDGLSYGEVEARANRLAHHLRRLGVGPDVLVAMCTGRTSWRVVGIVAVLKAGGAYVSLDPTHPPERLAFLLEDSRAPVLLTEEPYREALPATGAEVLALDTDWPAVEGSEEFPPPASLSSENLAYVVYTSGSTGKPKGVEIPHTGLMNLVRWHDDCYAVRPEDRGTQIASPAFDASIWELWPYLAAGASVHVPDEETRLSSPGMVRWWSQKRITLAYLMTPLAEGVLEEEIPEGLELETRALIIGGDRLHRGPDPAVGFRLMNHYGPAEYSVTCTVVEVPPETPGIERGIPTIGRPVDNTSIYLLDRRLEPVPIGCSGELFISGIGLARGYHHRPALTAERFIPDPYLGEPGARMYRTADLVRYLGDGDMDFLGRLDHQVKVRGFRIELGEIESVLGDHPGVREVAVLVREDQPGNKRLAAYVVPRPGASASAEELSEYLGEHLPSYMVASAFVELESLPLTPNGKVDRRALPEPEWTSVEYVAPRTPAEEAVAEIWCEVLGVERVGVEDDFFDLGGHSLLATRVIFKLRSELDTELPLSALFESPTVAGLAERVSSGGQLGSELDAIAQVLDQIDELPEELARQMVEEREGRR